MATIYEFVLAKVEETATDPARPRPALASLRRELAESPSPELQENAEHWWSYVHHCGWENDPRLAPISPPRPWGIPIRPEHPQ